MKLVAGTAPSSKAASSGQQGRGPDRPMVSAHGTAPRIKCHPCNQELSGLVSEPQQSHPFLINASFIAAPMTQQSGGCG